VERDSSVGISLGYGLDDGGSRVRFPAGAWNFSIHLHAQNGSGAHPAPYPMGKRGSFPGVKRPGHEADHSPPSSTEVKECVKLYLHFPNTPFMAWCLVKQRDNFTFALPYHSSYLCQRVEKLTVTHRYYISFLCLSCIRKELI
jgi:hypothetical protein